MPFIDSVNSDAEAGAEALAERGYAGRRPRGRVAASSLQANG